MNIFKEYLRRLSGWRLCVIIFCGVISTSCSNQKVALKKVLSGDEVLYELFHGENGEVNINYKNEDLKDIWSGQKALYDGQDRFVYGEYIDGDRYEEFLIYDQNGHLKDYTKKRYIGRDRDKLAYIENRTFLYNEGELVRIESTTESKVSWDSSFKETYEILYSQETNEDFYLRNIIQVELLPVPLPVFQREGFGSGYKLIKAVIHSIADLSEPDDSRTEVISCEYMLDDFGKVLELRIKYEAERLNYLGEDLGPVERVMEFVHAELE